MDWEICEELVIECTGHSNPPSLSPSPPPPPPLPPPLQPPSPLTPLPPTPRDPQPPTEPQPQQPLPPNTYRLPSTPIPRLISHSRNSASTGPVRSRAVSVSRTTISGTTYNATQSRSTIPVTGDTHSAMPTFERHARQSIERFMQDVRDVAGTSGGSTTQETTSTRYPRVVASAGDSSNPDDFTPYGSRRTRLGSVLSRVGIPVLHAMYTNMLPLSAAKEAKQVWFRHLWTTFKRKMKAANCWQSKDEASVCAARHKYQYYYYPYTAAHISTFIMGVGTGDYSYVTVSNHLVPNLLQAMVDDFPQLLGKLTPIYVSAAISDSLAKLRQQRTRDTHSAVHKIGKSPCTAADIAAIINATPPTARNYAAMCAAMCIAAATGARACTVSAIRLCDITQVEYSDDPDDPAGTVTVSLNLYRTKGVAQDW
jgi:hypothetical protein